MRRVILLLSILVAAYIGYPCLTLYWIDRALLTNDKEAFERLNGFPARAGGHEGRSEGPGPRQG